MVITLDDIIKNILSEILTRMLKKSSHKSLQFGGSKSAKKRKRITSHLAAAGLGALGLYTTQQLYKMYRHRKSKENLWKERALHKFDIPIDMLSIDENGVIGGRRKKKSRRRTRK